MFGEETFENRAETLESNEKYCKLKVFLFYNKNMYQLRVKLWHSDCHCQRIPGTVAQNIIKVYTNLEDILSQVVKEMDKVMPGWVLTSQTSMSTENGVRKIRLVESFHDSPYLDFSDNSLANHTLSVNEWKVFATNLKPLIDSVMNEEKCEMILFTSIP